MMMTDAELYKNSNVMQKRDAILCLEEFGGIIKWKKGGERIIDIGCGDGSVTNDILKKFIPPNYKKIVGCDISEKMVKFANENNSSGNTEFMVLNIEGKLPFGLQNSFDQAFSFYALHWITHQENAFTNIYNLLAEGGGCWLMFLQHIPLFTVFRILARSDRWRYWLKDVEHFISPYMDSLDPEKEIKRMMEKIGFTNVEVHAKQLTYTYPTIEMLKKALSAVNPFEIPKEQNDIFIDDILNVLSKLPGATQIVNKNNNNITPDNVKFHYTLLIASGNKPYYVEPPANAKVDTNIKHKHNILI